MFKNWLETQLKQETFYKNVHGNSKQFKNNK